MVACCLCADWARCVGRGVPRCPQRDNCRREGRLLRAHAFPLLCGRGERRALLWFVRGGPPCVQRLFDTAESDEQQQAFRREVSMLKTLRHPVRPDVYPERVVPPASERVEAACPPPSATICCIVHMKLLLSVQCIVGFIGATLEKPRIIVTEFMARGSLMGILHDTSIELPTPLRLQMALDMALGPHAGTCTHK